MTNKEQEAEDIFLLMTHLTLSLEDIAKMRDYEKDFLLKQLKQTLKNKL